MRTPQPSLARGSARRSAAAVAPSGPVIPREGDFHDEPLTNIRKTIARRLGESIGPIPTFYLTAEFDLSRVTEMRAAMAELGDQFKVSVNDVLLKATAVALSQHPEVNAHWLGDKIHHNRVHLGMAVATDDGLIVPVIWDADRKRMSEISREAKELAKRAREQARPEEFTGSTFSVSNLGMFGIDQFTVIINLPEGILAIGTSEEKLVVVNGEPVVRNRVRVTMSCDHRIIDGCRRKFLNAATADREPIDARVLMRLGGVVDRVFRPASRQLAGRTSRHTVAEPCPNCGRGPVGILCRVRRNSSPLMISPRAVARHLPRAHQSRWSALHTLVTLLAHRASSSATTSTGEAAGI
jgi:hypothetical protein